MKISTGMKNYFYAQDKIFVYYFLLFVFFLLKPHLNVNELEVDFISGKIIKKKEFETQQTNVFHQHENSFFEQLMLEGHKRCEGKKRIYSQWDEEESDLRQIEKKKAPLFNVLSMVVVNRCPWLNKELFVMCELNINFNNTTFRPIQPHHSLEL